MTNNLFSYMLKAGTLIDQWVSDGIGCPAFDTYYDIDTIYWANLPEPPKPF